MKAIFILYVADQDASTRFYSRVLDRPPTLHVPGMTEFMLGDEFKLGLMPIAGIKKLLPTMTDPAEGGRAPRAEVYLIVSDVTLFHRRALEAGAVELSPPAERSWGDLAAYSLDPDGHVIAFARPAEPA